MTIRNVYERLPHTNTFTNTLPCQTRCTNNLKNGDQIGIYWITFWIVAGNLGYIFLWSHKSACMQPWRVSIVLGSSPQWLGHLDPYQSMFVYDDMEISTGQIHIIYTCRWLSSVNSDVCDALSWINFRFGAGIIQRAHYCDTQVWYDWRIKLSNEVFYLWFCAVSWTSGFFSITSRFLSSRNFSIVCGKCIFVKYRWSDTQKRPRRRGLCIFVLWSDFCSHE